LVALFNHLASAAGTHTAEGQKWLREMEHARRFVERMWKETAQGKKLYLYTGTTKVTGPDAKRNDEAIPLDVQTWAVLALDGKAHEPALNWAMQHCSSRRADHPHGYDFKAYRTQGEGYSENDGVWWEGTAQVACALQWLGRTKDAEPILESLRGALKGSAEAKEDSPRGIPAANIPELWTGFVRTYPDGKEVRWNYSDTVHVGATAWYIFAELGVNPYYLPKPK
jgi:hypothetical protein